MESAKLIQLLDEAVRLKSDDQALLKRAAALASRRDLQSIIESIDIYYKILLNKPDFANALCGRIDASIKVSKGYLSSPSPLCHESAVQYADLAVKDATNLWLQSQQGHMHIIKHDGLDSDEKLPELTKQGLRKAYTQKAISLRKVGRLSEETSLIEDALKHPAQLFAGNEELDIYADLLTLYRNLGNDTKLQESCARFEEVYERESKKGTVLSLHNKLMLNWSRIFLGKDSVRSNLKTHKDDPLFMDLVRLHNNQIEIGCRVEQVRKNDSKLALVLDRLCEPGYLPKTQVTRFLEEYRKAPLSRDQQWQVRRLVLSLGPHFDPQIYKELREEVASGVLERWYLRHRAGFDAFCGIAALGLIVGSVAISGFFSYQKSQTEQRAQQVEQRAQRLETRISSLEKENLDLKWSPPQPELKRMREDYEKNKQTLEKAKKTEEDVLKVAKEAEGYHNAFKLASESLVKTQAELNTIQAENETYKKKLADAKKGDADQETIKNLTEAVKARTNTILEKDKEIENSKKQLADAQKRNDDFTKIAKALGMDDEPEKTLRALAERQKQEPAPRNSDVEKLAKERDDLKKKVEEIEGGLRSVSLPAFAKGDPRSQDQKQRAAKLEEERGGLKKKVEELDGKLMNYDIQRLRQDNDALKKIQVDVARGYADLEKRLTELSPDKKLPPVPEEAVLLLITNKREILDNFTARPGNAYQFLLKPDREITQLVFYSDKRAVNDQGKPEEKVRVRIDFKDASYVDEDIELPGNSKQFVEKYRTNRSIIRIMRQKINSNTTRYSHLEVSDLDEIMASLPNDTEALLEYARYWARTDVKKENVFLLRILDIDQNNATACYRLALNSQENNPELARMYFEKAVQLSPNDPAKADCDKFLKSAEVILMMPWYDSPSSQSNKLIDETKINRALKIRPSDRDILKRIGEIYLESFSHFATPRETEYRKSEHYFKKALELSRSDKSKAEIEHKLGQLYERNGNIALAATKYITAITADSSNLECIQSLSLLRVNKDKSRNLSESVLNTIDGILSEAVKK